MTFPILRGRIEGYKRCGLCVVCIVTISFFILFSKLSVQGKYQISREFGRYVQGINGFRLATLKRAALRGYIASSRLCHGPHNFEPRRNTSGNLSVLPETSATTCFKGGKTNSPEELNTFLRSDGLRKMSQQLNTLLADAIVRFRLILETMLW